MQNRSSRVSAESRRPEKVLLLLSALTPISLFAYHLIKERPQRGRPFLRGAFSSPFSTALTLDLCFSTFIFLRLARRETRAGRVKGPFWLYAFLNTFVGLSPALPLLVLNQERQRDSGADALSVT